LYPIWLSSFPYLLQLAYRLCLLTLPLRGKSHHVLPLAFSPEIFYIAPSRKGGTGRAIREGRLLLPLAFWGLITIKKKRLRQDYMSIG
jgi:hypothetical protein